MKEVFANQEKNCLIFIQNERINVIVSKSVALVLQLRLNQQLFGSVVANSHSSNFQLVNFIIFLLSLVYI